MNGIPSIGANLHIDGTEAWEDDKMDIVIGKRIDIDALKYAPRLRDSIKVMEAIHGLMEAYPEKEIIALESKDYLAKLEDYKPLAKVEELEEQNYNMIDNIPNNGFEKSNREDEKKKAQSNVRPSLKARLQEKQRELAMGRCPEANEPDKAKTARREM
jgi:hypothetical protein